MNEQTIPPRTRRGGGFYIALALFAGVLGLGAVSWYMGGTLVASANHPIGPPPPSLAASDVTFSSESGATIHGEFLRKTPRNERVAAIGVSLGAASIALADGQASFDAVVLESMYPTISEAIEDRLRLRLGAAGTLLAPLLTLQLQPRLGIDMDQLRPIEHIASVGAPLLLIHGAEDRHTLIDEARAVFARAAEPKEFWEVPKAAHVDLHQFARAEYERRVSEFIVEHLSTPET